MALASHAPAEWNDILSTTMHNYRKTLTDNVFESRPLLNFFESNGRKRTISGGVSIVEPIMYTDGEFQAYGEWDPVNVTPQLTATAAQYDWKLLASTIAISGLEEAQNNSRELQVNLLEAKIMQSEETLKTNLNKMLFGTYTVDYTGYKGFWGLNYLINTGVEDLLTGTPAHCGGIDGQVETWWQSKIIDGSGVTDGASLEDALRTGYNTASDAGNDRCDAIFTNEFGFGFYESTLTPQVRYTDVAKANLGFQNLMFKNVPMFWDFDCSGVVEGVADNDGATYYGLNSKYLGIVCHADRNFTQSPFTDNLSGNAGGTGSAAVPATTAAVHSIDARVSFITTYGNTTTRNRRRHFKVTAVPAP